VRPRVALGAWLALLALAAWQIAHTRFVADMSSFLPLDPTAEQRVLVDQLRDGAISRVILVGIEGGDAKARAAVSNALSKALAASPLVAGSSNGAGATFDRERELLLAHRYVLSPRVTPERFTVQGLRAAIGDTIDLLASQAGMLVKPLVPRDPTGEMVAVVENLRPPQSPPMTEGVWSSKEGDRALLVVRTRAAGSDTDAQARIMATIDSAFAQAVRAAGAPQGMHVVMSGPGVFSVKARAMIQHDVERLALASLVVVAGLLLFVYRSPLALGLGMLPVLSGAVAGVAAVSLGFGMVHGITLGFGTTLIGEAVDYSIYLFVQRDRERADDWVTGFWPTVRLGVFTSIAGFAALCFSGVAGLAQLGVYSIAGLVAAALVTRFVMPSLLPAGFRVRDLSAFGDRLLRATARMRRGAWWVGALGAAAAVVLVVQRDRLWDMRIESLNPISVADRRLDAKLREALGATDARHVIAVRGASAEAALAAAEHMGEKLEPLAASGRIGGYESPARFLPSAAVQEKRLQSLPDEAQLRPRLREALAGLPLRAERLEPFIADVARAKSGGILTREAIANTALDEALDGLLFRDSSGQWNAMLGLRRPIDVAAVRSAIAASGIPGAVLLDVRGELDSLYAGYFERALAASAVGLAAIVVLLFIALRSPARVGRVMAPLIAGVLVVAACHALAGVRMTLLHLVGLLLVVAIGSNYALFFDQMRTSSQRSGRTAASLALANATTVATFAILSLSGIPVLNAIGSTVALGAFTTLFFAALVMPPVESARAHAAP
jgi:predicted exporter